MKVLKDDGVAVREAIGGKVVADGYLVQDEKWHLRDAARKFLASARSIRGQLHEERDRTYLEMGVQATRRRIAVAMALKKRSAR